MKSKIKIPKKNEFSFATIAISLVAFLLFCMSLHGLLTEPTNNLAGITGTKVKIIFTVCMLLIPVLGLIFSLYLNNRYYNPKFRTTEVRSLMGMLALGEGKIYEVVDDHIINFHLLLRCRGFGEEVYYINLQVPEEEVEYFDFRKKIGIIGNQRLSAISFHRIARQSEDEKKFRVGYKFWTLKSEKGLLFSVPSLTC